MLYKLTITVLCFTTLLSFNNAKKGERKVPCPDESEVVCIDCVCEASSGFNTCTPSKNCPSPVKSPSEIKKKDRKAKCQFGSNFVAQCTLCECSGQGRDHCAMCFALPVRKNGQSEEINKQLPQSTDNRFFNYEINGWDRLDDDEE